MIKEGKYPIIGSHSLNDADNNYIDWLFKTTQENKKYSDNTKKSYRATVNHLKKFAGNRVPFEAIDKSFVARFYDYLKHESVNSKGISTSANSAIKYHKQFYHHLAKASALFNFELPLNIKYAQDKTDSKPKEYLTVDELKQLISTPEPDFTLRMGFLFGCFTSIGFNELVLAKYNDIEQDNKGKHYIKIQRGKTTYYNKVPLSKSALDVVEQMRGVNGKSHSQTIFKGLKSSGYTNQKLLAWVNRAGITKHITPHCCRNTFSGIHYDRYKDVGALMKILDHKDISTTQRYLAKFLKNIDVDVDRLPEFDLGF
jgi:integrase